MLPGRPPVRRGVGSAGPGAAGGDGPLRSCTQGGTTVTWPKVGGLPATMSHTRMAPGASPVVGSNWSGPLVPVMALFYVAQRNLVAGLTAGGVKG